MFLFYQNMHKNKLWWMNNQIYRQLNIQIDRPTNLPTNYSNWFLTLTQIIKKISKMINYSCSCFYISNLSIWFKLCGAKPFFCWLFSLPFFSQSWVSQYFRARRLSKIRNLLKKLEMDTARGSIEQEADVGCHFMDGSSMELSWISVSFWQKSSSTLPAERKSPPIVFGMLFPSTNS